MAGGTAIRTRLAWISAKNLIFACIALMMTYVVVHNESFLQDRIKEEWQHIESFKWWLLIHGTAGACAMLLAPMQFSERMRRRFTRLHRFVGWTYVGAVFI